MCFDLEHSGMVECQGFPDQSQTYSRESKCDSRFPVQEGLGNSNRMVFAPSCVSKNLPSLAQPNGALVCHQLEYQTPYCCVDPLWEALDTYAFCLMAILPQLEQKMITYRCKVIVIAPRWPGMPWFWDLFELSRFH